MEDDLLNAGLAYPRGQWPMAMANDYGPKPKAQGREPWACGLGVSRCGGTEGG